MSAGSYERWLARKEEYRKHNEAREAKQKAKKEHLAENKEIVAILRKMQELLEAVEAKLDEIHRS